MTLPAWPAICWMRHVRFRFLPCGPMSSARGWWSLLGKSNLKSAAIAPDGGSERLRRVINKGITEPELLTAAEALAEIGVTNLKLYYMIGLPTETDQDLDEMVDLTLRIRERVMAVGRRKGYLGTLTLSVNCFVPKPWTPFQYYPFVQVKVLKKRLQYLRKALGRTANIRITADHPDRAFFRPPWPAATGGWAKRCSPLSPRAGIGGRL